MTEAEWLVCRNVGSMREFVEGKVSDRKLRLFAVAYAVRIERFMADNRSRTALRVAAQFADGEASEVQRRRAEENATLARDAAQAKYNREVDADTYAEGDEVISEGYRLLAAVNASAAARASLLLPVAVAARDVQREVTGVETWGWDAEKWASGNGRNRGLKNPRYPVELQAKIDLIRDIFGNPFRPVDFSPTWRTDTTVALAGQMYDSRNFSAMPILADALQDAGCDNEDVLNHCREPGPHVRGCWVVDLVLMKE